MTFDDDDLPGFAALSPYELSWALRSHERPEHALDGPRLARTRKYAVKRQAESRARQQRGLADEKTMALVKRLHSILTPEEFDRTFARIRAGHLGAR